MKKSKRLIIFDLDGTLVNSLQDITTAVNGARSRAGLAPVSADRVRRAVGDGVGNLLRRVLLADHAGITLKEALAWFKPIYENCMLDTTRPYHGIPETLAALRGDGWRLAVLSNKETRLARAVIRGLPGLNGRFDAVFGGDAFAERKPSPVGVRAIMAALGGQEGRTMMVGDSCNDVLAGRHAGCVTVAVAYGFTDRDTLKACRPHYQVSEPLSLLGIAGEIGLTPG